MKFLGKKTAGLLVSAMLILTSAVEVFASAVSVTTSDGAGISFRNSFDSEVERPINEILSDDTHQKNGINRVITVKSESPELVPVDIYIRINSTDEKTVKNYKIDVTDSSGALIKESDVTEDEGVYKKEIYLGCFNNTLGIETKIYMIEADNADGIGLDIIAKSRPDGAEEIKEGIKTFKTVGIQNAQIRPGMYTLETDKQVRITTSQNEVSFYKAAGTSGETVYLNSGDRIEYHSALYLEPLNGAGQANAEKLQMFGKSIYNMMPGCYTEISGGFIAIYDEDGKEKYKNTLPMVSEGNSYVLNCGTSKKEEISQAEEEAVIKLQSSVIYTAGTDIGTGDYIGTGEGLVKVYDAAGYARTVIRLKKEDSQEQGVLSYVFKLTEGETFVTEGNIEFKEVKASSDN